MYLLWDEAGMKGGRMGVGEGGVWGGHLDREDLHVTMPPNNFVTKSAVCVKTSLAPCIVQWRPDLCHNHLLMRLAHNAEDIKK